MPFNPIPTAKLTYHPHNITDYMLADPGQWFIGVLDTSTHGIYIIPIDVHDNPGAVNNNSAGAMNRYASGGSPHLWISRPDDWRINLPLGMTRHGGVCQMYNLTEENCLGFSLIKMGNGFAMLKGSSTSLNARHGGSNNHNFSQQTFYNRPSTIPAPGSSQMPANFVDAILEFFRGYPFNITNIIASND